MNRYTHQRITGQQLSDSMDDLGLTAGDIMRLTGTHRMTVENWLGDRDDRGIPHWMTVLLALWTRIPATLTLAKAITRDRINEKPGR